MQGRIGISNIYRIIRGWVRLAIGGLGNLGLLVLDRHEGGLRLQIERHVGSPFVFSIPPTSKFSKASLEACRLFFVA
jgi:hypothetical protein